MTEQILIFFFFVSGDAVVQHRNGIYKSTYTVGDDIYSIFCVCFSTLRSMLFMFYNLFMSAGAKAQVDINDSGR